MNPTDSRIVDWLEGHPHFAVVKRPATGPWKIWDGPVSDEHTELCAQGATLRVAVTNAIERPYRL